jgi:hypothetical protein
LEKYRGSWVVQFSEFLLPPGDAAAFVADLADIDVLLRGCDLWTYLDPEKTKLMEILTGGDVIDDKMSDDVRSNAQVIREFLLHELTPDVHLVSLWYADPDLWDVILQYTTYP